MKPPLIIFAALLIALIACSPSAFAQASSGSGEIKVVVTGLRNDHGRLGCGLFNGPDGFPREEAKEFRGGWASITGDTATCDFKDVPAGAYAATVLHDENRNGKMDFNWMHLPTKGYGFSNNAKATLSPPSFDAAKVSYDGKGTLTMPITIVYWTKGM